MLPAHPPNRAAHARSLKRHVQMIDRISFDRIEKRVLMIKDSIVGKRTRNQNRHALPRTLKRRDFDAGGGHGKGFVKRKRQRSLLPWFENGLSREPVATRFEQLLRNCIVRFIKQSNF